MAEGQVFPQRLEDALAARRARLDREELPRLRETWKLFQAAFHGVADLLRRKGLLHEDPYRYELKIADVQNPPEGAFAESERAEQMSVRISQFEAYVDFLINYYQFDCGFLAIGRIKRLLGLVRYFNFAQLSETSGSPSTRGLAELVNSVRKGTDELSAGVVNEGVGQLEKATREVLAALKVLSEFQREAYKLEIRQLALTGLDLDAESATRRDEALRKVRHRLLEVAADLPFYPELVEEVLNEDFSPEAETLRDALLARLAVAEEKKAAQDQGKSRKSILIDGIRILSGASTQLDDAFMKLSVNSGTVEKSKESFGGQLLKMFRRLFSQEDRGVRYEIEISDPLTGEMREETVDMAAFVEEGKRKARLLSSLLPRGGQAMRRLEAALDDHAFRFLERNIEELQRLIRRMNALDDHLKSGFPVEERARYRGVKSEITTIKNCIIKANQKKHEYHAQKEEEEQLRRLGIKPE